LIKQLASSVVKVSLFQPVLEPRLANLITYGGISNPWDLDATVKDIPKATSSPEAMRRLLQWIDDCKENHDECKLDGAPKLPHRYLDLGNEIGGPVKLRESLGEAGRYLALSYSWGRIPSIKTTMDNIKDHQQGIPLDHLPQLFKDLAMIAQTLGIRYMWIDALCIIQGNREDWETQSVRMLDVYRNAYITVASVSTTTPIDSCFFSTVGITKIGPLRASTISHFPSSIGDERSMAQFPMLSRAWTYQERYISQRVVYFGSQELLWDCFRHRTCCCGVFSHHVNEVDRNLFHQTIIRPRTSGDLLKWQQETLWREMVIQYSQLHLTVQSDKLPALAGLADIFQRATGHTYVAGMWRETLLIDLCWSRMDSKSKESTSTLHAPSWSWASINGGIEYIRTFYHHRDVVPKRIRNLAAVLDITCEARISDNVLQQVRFVELDARLIPSDRVISLKRERPLGDEYYALELLVGNNEFEGSVVSDAKVDLLRSEPRFFLPLVSDNNLVFGIVLVKAGEFHHIEHFSRIGMVTLDGDDDQLCSEILKLETENIRII
jgi:hypothetical protein